MRVILDANVLISYLLAPGQPRTITDVVEFCFGDEIELVTPRELIDELRQSVVQSRYLRKRIPFEEAEALVQVLLSISTVPPRFDDDFPDYTTDIDDDYLVAYALMHDVDYLVTGDRHLLVLGTVEGTAIMEPIDFFEIVVQE